MKSLSIAVLCVVGIVAIFVLTLMGDVKLKHAEHELATDVQAPAPAPASEAGPLLTNPIAMVDCYRVNCASGAATSLLVPMDGGPVGGIGPVSTIYVAPCEFDIDGGATCITTRDVRVGSSDVTAFIGIHLDTGESVSLDSKNGFCAGVGGAQQVDVCVGRQ